ncbi:MAG: hypothetical protein ACJ73S_18105 [Mycobacteriales bacterium]
MPLPDRLDPLPPLSFQPPRLVELAGRYDDHGGALRDLSGRFAAAAEATWAGEAADAFNRLLRALTGHLVSAAEAVGELAAGLRTLAAELELAGRMQGKAERDMRELDRGQLQPLRRHAETGGADDAEIRRMWEQIRARQSTIADDAYRARAYAAGAMQRFRRTLTAVVEASYRTLPPSLSGEPGAATDGWLLGGPGEGR